MSRRGRLASGFQLWRANWLGRLRAVDEEGDPLTSEELRVLIADDLAARGLAGYPKPGQVVPERCWEPGEMPG